MKINKWNKNQYKMEEMKFSAKAENFYYSKAIIILLIKIILINIIEQIINLLIWNLFIILNYLILNIINNEYKFLLIL